LTANELEAAASANLSRTYFALGLALPGSRRVTGEHFEACVGPTPHPVCNFAIWQGEDDADAASLVHASDGFDAFHVYLLSGAGSENPLRRAGMHLQYELVQMVANPGPQEGEPVPLLQADTGEARAAVARFMVDQFFPRQRRGFRTMVQQATTSAHELPLFFAAERNAIAAALMLCHSPEMVGVYNLCVSPGQRNRGLGSAMVRWAGDLAAAQGARVTLQCDRRLEPWYERLGYRRIGSVRVFGWSKDGLVAIMSSKER
jgi:GNAT superfamily N-acetyltransferase